MNENEPNRIRRIFLQLAAICGITLSLCSCATPTLVHPAALANPVSFNGEAGKGDWIKLNLRLENGKEIGPFMVDTGWPYKTVLDKSLAPLLGKRLGSGIFYSPFMGGFVSSETYKTPKLYLGGAQLQMGPHVFVCDLQKLSRGLKGILGMDCLRHYCVQFDFARDEMRFLDPDAPANGDFGHPIPLLMIDNLVIARSDVFGIGKVLFCPDTGCHECDAMLKPKLLRRLETKLKSSWSTSFPGIKNNPVKVAGFSKGIFAGETYNDLTIAAWAGRWPDGNLLGLPFLARNRVTFDFPRRTMYLEKENSGPRNPALFASEEAGKYLRELKRSGQLPGWTTNDFGEGDSSDAPMTNYPVSLTFNLRKEPVPGCVDVTAKVKALAAGGARRILADDGLPGFDPAPDHLKTLRVTLHGDIHDKVIEIAEGRTLALPSNAQMLEARYGVLSGPVFTDAREKASFYHYVVIKNVPDGPWKLSKAWQSDVEGHLIKNYSVP